MAEKVRLTHETYKLGGISSMKYIRKFTFYFLTLTSLLVQYACNQSNIPYLQNGAEDGSNIEINETTLTPLVSPEESQTIVLPTPEIPQNAETTPAGEVEQRDVVMVFRLDSEVLGINAYNPQEIDFCLQDIQSEILYNPKPEEISPDGTKLLVNTINAEEKIYRLVIVDLENRSAQYLIKVDEDQISPQWNPNGEKIAFVLRSNDESSIYTVNLDGSNLELLPGGYAWDRRPMWSPDGERIFFLSSKSYGVYSPSDIFVIDVDGSNITKLTDNTYEISDFSLSPDGSMIAFSAPLNNEDIYILKSDGSGLENISNNEVQDTSPTWFPDSSKLAFRSNRDGNWEVYTMDPSGNNIERITNSPGMDAPVLWSPLGDFLAILSDRTSSNQIFIFLTENKTIHQITYAEEYPFLADIWVSQGVNIVP